MNSIAIDKPSTANRLAIERYLSRHRLYPAQLADEPSANLGLAVVIPCFAEPAVGATLESLAACAVPNCAVEVIVVINSPEAAPADVRAANEHSRSEVEAWNRRSTDGPIRYRTLDYPSLPPRHAGVGLARKLGMDEAVAGFAKTPGANGVIASLDADCLVRPDYLQALTKHFGDDPACPGASIYFEHRLEQAEDASWRRAMAEYELHLRYYVAGMRMAGFPYAFHTVGSAMAVRAESYARQGGMNRRKGGEDFYFIQKLAALGGYAAIVNTTVYPAVRRSDRVPFGTGAALTRTTDSATGFQTYPVQVFLDLQAFCRAITTVPDGSLDVDTIAWSPGLREFLAQHDFERRLQEIRRNVSSTDSFRKRVFRWFNAFRFMKFANFARENFYASADVADAAAELLTHLEPQGSVPTDAEALLERYRAADQAAGAGFSGLEIG